MNTELIAPPAGAVVLFDGTDLSQWGKADDPQTIPTWPLADGAMTTHGGNIVSRQHFTDCHLHLEFWCNDSPAEVTGQGRANSGVFLQGRYEIQVLDSFSIAAEPGKGDCGAMYNQAAPLINACRPPEHWQTYDVFFRAPRFVGGEKKENARITVLQNGQVIHNNIEIPHQTGGAINEQYDQPGPLMLQDHGNAVRYRNVWILPLPHAGVDRY